MDWQDFLTKASLLLIGAFCTGLVTILINYLKSRKGNLVSFEKTYDYPLINVSTLIRNDLRIIYKERELDNLILYEYCISNEGEKDRLNGNWRGEAIYGGWVETGGNPLNRDKSAGTDASD